MFGFIGCIGKKRMKDSVLDTYGVCGEKLRVKEYQCEGFYIKQCTLDKFYNDKVFFWKSGCFFSVEGIIYNYSELKKRYGVSTNDDAIFSLYLDYGDRCVEKLNGNFSMVIHDGNKVLLYTNHTSYKPLFYLQYKDECIFSTDINWLMKAMRRLDISCRLDKDAAICLLTHGYMLGDNTLSSCVKKVMPGHYMKIENGSMMDVVWMSYEDIQEYCGCDYGRLIDQAEVMFTEAVKRIYEKDEEYGYKHFCTLSGGLDSRSVAFVAYNLGFDQTFATIGEKGCLDIAVAKKIAIALHGQHFVAYLDGGDYLTELDEAVRGNGGTITYPGFAHLYYLFRSMNLQNYGQVCTGEVGDVLFGGGHRELKKRKTEIDTGAFAWISDTPDLLSEGFIRKEAERYKNAFYFFLYNRGLNSAQNGWYASYNYTESASPFLDIDFMRFILSIPDRYIKDSRFYIDWMKKYHPDMIRYRWTKTRTRPDASLLHQNMIKLGIVARTRFLGQNLSMNPYQIWMRDNALLRDYIEKKIIQENIGLIDDSYVLKKMSDRIIKARNVQNIFMLATLLKSVKEYNLKCD